MRDSFLPGFREDIPWVIAEVELEEGDGVRLIARLNVDPDRPLAEGTQVRTAFDDLEAGVALPCFEVAV